MGDIKFKSTDKAKQQGADLQQQAEYYNSLVDQLQQIGTTLSQTWLGDMADIQDILNQISEVANEFDGKMIPAMSLLGSGVESFAEQVDKVANKKDPGKVDGKGKKGKKKGYWEKRAEDFGDNFDYSKTTGLVTGIFDTIKGVEKTKFDIAETAWDGIGWAVHHIF